MSGIGFDDTLSKESMDDAISTTGYICPFFYFSMSDLKVGLGGQTQKKGGSVACHCLFREDNVDDKNNLLRVSGAKPEERIENFIRNNNSPIKEWEINKRGITFINEQCLSKEGCGNCPFLQKFLADSGLEGLIIPSEESKDETVRNIVKDKWGKDARTLYVKRDGYEKNLSKVNQYAYMLSQYKTLCCDYGLVKEGEIIIKETGDTGGEKKEKKKIFKDENKKGLAMGYKALVEKMAEKNKK